MIKQLHLASVAEKEAGHYSEGEKQRLCIGRALSQLTEGKMILADEIFSNIDKENRRGISEALAEIWKEHTVLMVSHEEEYMTWNKKLTVSKGHAVLESREVITNG